MRLRSWTAALLAIALLAGGVFLFSERLPRATLPGGTELRVLKVSFGANHSFSTVAGAKAHAAEFLPKSWHQRLGLRSLDRPTLHDSFVVWLAEFDPGKNTFAPLTFDRPHVIFPNGDSVLGQKIRWGTNMFCLVFPAYPRTEPVITFRVWDVNETIEFKVKNTGPKNLANWAARPLPQTYYTSHTAFILKQGPQPAKSARFYLNTRPLSKSAPGWTQWRLTMLDPTGNWFEFPGMVGWFEPPKFPFQGTPLKLLGHCSEYISAGMVPLPSDLAILPLVAQPRAYELGLTSLFLLGPGEYTFQNGAVLLKQGTNALALRPELFGTTQGTNWVFELATDKPSLLLLFQAGGGNIRARLRERRGTRRDGKAFDFFRFYSATNQINPLQVARLIPMFIRTDQHDLEAEVIVSHPPVEFFIDAKSLSPQ